MGRGRIHCMFTSANKPFSFFPGHHLFWYFSSSQPFCGPLLVVSGTTLCIRAASTKCRKHCSTSEHSWLDFFCFCFVLTYEKIKPTLEKGVGGDRKPKPKIKTNKHPGAINQSLQPMLCNCSIWRQNRVYNTGGHECSKTKRR